MPISPGTIRSCFQRACLLELHALKPGNVGLHGDGHGMQLAQFVVSANTASYALIKPANGVGQRILHTVQVTHDAVGDNTNLGILLLAAPIVQALLTGSELEQLPQAVKKVLAELSIDDADYAYQAIQLANPGGMGEVAEHDVQSKPEITLLEAMQLSAEHDQIGFQYAHGFERLFNENVACYQHYLALWGSMEWAASAVFMKQLRDQADSLILRKKGLLKAQEISAMIAPLADDLLASSDPNVYRSRLLSLDGHLKNIDINPGTTADLTVATLFLALLQSASK